MAEDKKSFLLYCDIIHTITKLTDEQSGKLFKHILKYVNDENPVSDDILTEIAFEPIKQSLKRDLTKYNEKKEKLVEAGHKGAKKRWGIKNNNSHPITDNGEAKNEIASMPVSVSVSVSDNTNTNTSVGGWEKVIELFPPTKHQGLIDASIVWNNLQQKEKQSVMRHLNPYIKNTEERFMKQIGNYFNERIWEKMKSKSSISKIKMLDYNFIIWVQTELQMEKFEETRSYLAKLQTTDLNTFNELEELYKQLKINNND
jgi:hypothetical protein